MFQKFSLIKFLRLSSLLYIFLLPFQTRYIWRQGFLHSQPWEAATYSLYVSDLLLFIIFIVVIYAWFQEDSRSQLQHQYKSLFVTLSQLDYKRSYRLIRYTILFIAWMGITFFWASQKMVALFQFITIIKSVSFSIILLGLKINVRLLLQVFVSSAIVQAVWGGMQFLYQAQFASSLLGVSALHPQQLGVSVIEFVTGSETFRTLRAYGGFGHPNILGGFLALGVIVQSYLFASTKSFKKQILQGSILVILMIGILVSFSRSGWIMLVFELCAVYGMLWLYSNYADSEMKTQENKIQFRQYINKYQMIAGIFVVVGGLLFVMYPNEFKTRLGIGQQQRLESHSIEERIELVDQSQKILVDNFILGVGVGNYEHTIGAEDNFEQKPWNYQPVHNIYLLLLAEIGLIGMGLLGVLFVNMMLLVVRYMHKIGVSLQSLVSFSLFEGILLVGLFDHYLWTTSFGVILIGIIISQLLNTLGSHDSKMP